MKWLLFCSFWATAAASSCRSLDSVFNNSDVKEEIAEWLTIGGESFLADLYIDYLTDDSKGPIANVHGSELLREGSLQFPVCNRLPLNEHHCYLTSNPRSSFLEHLVAKHIPLGKHVIKALDIVRDHIEEFEQEIHDFMNEFYRIEGTGNCIAGNHKMIGIYDSTGFPP